MNIKLPGGLRFSVVVDAGEHGIMLENAKHMCKTVTKHGHDTHQPSSDNP